MTDSCFPCRMTGNWNTSASGDRQHCITHGLLIGSFAILAAALRFLFTLATTKRSTASCLLIIAACVTSVPVRSQGWKDGRPPTYDGVPVQGQCIDFVALYCDQVLKCHIDGIDQYHPYKPPNSEDGAHWVWDDSRLQPHNTDRIYNSAPNIPGRQDIMVWSSSLGGYGHIAIVDSAADRHHVQVVDSNWSLNLSGQVHVVDLDTSPVLGWFRKQGNQRIWNTHVNAQASPWEPRARLYRLYNYRTHHHFYTSNYQEKCGMLSQTDSQGSIYSLDSPIGMGFVSATPGPGLVPLYRRYNRPTGDHLYTLSQGEIGPNDNDEGIECFVYDGTVSPVVPGNLASIWRAYYYAQQDHFYTLNQSEYYPDTQGNPAKAVQDGSVGSVQLPGQSGKVNAQASPWESQPRLYRLYNYRTHHHFYTANYYEKNALLNLSDQAGNIWALDSPVGMGRVSATPGLGLQPLYRRFDVNTGDYLYTLSQGEIGVGQEDQGIECYVYDSKSQVANPSAFRALYRFYYYNTHDHLYTLTPAECAGDVGNSRNPANYDGISGYLLGPVSSNHVNSAPKPGETRARLYRLFNYRTGHHYLTANYAEMTTLLMQRDVAGYLWTLDSSGGMGFVAAAPGSGLQPLYRRFDVTTGDTMYTLSQGEIGLYQEDQGIECFVYDSKTYNACPAAFNRLYRFYYYANRDHMYTLNYSECSGDVGQPRNMAAYDGVSGYLMNR